MKTTKNYLMALLLLGATTAGFTACSDDDNSANPLVSEAVQQTMSQKYPHAQNVKWSTRCSYTVAEFTDQYEATAWYTADGKWHMTETDIPFTALPEAVRTTFHASEYAAWTKDDVDMLERQGFETLYVIEVEQGEREVDLYYSVAGVFIKAVIDNDDAMEHSPVAPLLTAISNYLTENYPNGKIVEVDVEDDRDDPDYGCVEVDIIHDGISKEVFFNAQHAWVLSRWEVPVASLPQAVKDAVNGRYAGYVIDDAGFIKSAEKGEYYLLELEKDGVADVYVEVGEDGDLY